VTATRWRRGFTHLIPFAAGHELLRQRRSELELIRMTPDVLYNQMIGMRRASITLRISSPDPEVEAACDEVQFGSTKPFVACNELHPEQQTETSVYVAAYVAGVPRIRGPRDAARPLDAGPSSTIPRTSRSVLHMGNCPSRADPARGSRKPPPIPANPRNARVERPALGGNPRSGGVESVGARSWAGREPMIRIGSSNVVRRSRIRTLKPKPRVRTCHLSSGSDRTRMVFRLQGNRCDFDNGWN
jgi:hypothetical protein